MVAFDAEEPVAVLIGCKRPPFTHVHRIAVHPQHLRKGHGRHLLTSLRAKLAILGPPQLVAEISSGNAPARALFAACGWREDRTYVDVVSSDPVASPAPTGLVVPVTVTDLADIGLPGDDAPRSWDRSRATLLHRAERLLGLAIASGERLDACALYTREDGGGATIWSLSAAAGAEGDGALAVLLRELAHRERGALRIPRIEDDEIALDTLRRLGFATGEATIGVVAEAQIR
jgi:GNAT superfamily N-acetyltransferase